MPLLDDVRHEYERREKLADVWDWAVTGGDDSQDGLALRARRFNAAAHFAGNRKAGSSKADVRAHWQHAQEEYRTERDRLEQKIERRKHSGLPKSVRWVELMHHAPGPRIHAAVAWAQRDLLIRVSKYAEEELGMRVGEFPPFDDVECVHVAGSRHYRAENDVVIDCSSTRLNLGGDAGCAADINHLTDAAAEYRFYLDLRAL